MFSTPGKNNRPALSDQHYSKKIFVFNKINDNLSFPISKIKRHHIDIKNKLCKFIAKYKLNNLLIKFDLIIDEYNWYVIDIGFDPPKRLENIMVFKKKDFYRAYVYNWIYKRNLFKNFNFKNLDKFLIKINKNGKTKIFKK